MRFRRLLWMGIAMMVLAMPFLQAVEGTAALALPWDALTPDPNQPVDPTPTPTATFAPPATIAPADTPVAPTPGLTPGEEVTPTLPAVTQTPGASQPATPSPTPTPAQKKIVFHGEATTKAVWKSKEFTLYQNISAVDEAGNPLPVTIRDSGGFNIKLPGEYTVVYVAVHSDGVMEEQFVRSVTVYKTPEQEAAKILFNLPETSVRFRNENFTLLDVTAVDEHGNPIAVYLIDDGGFSTDKPGEYSVTYGAMHPLIEEEFTAVRRVVVLTKKETEKLEMADRLKATNSVQRYNKYMKYRKQVEQELTARMAELNLTLRQRVDTIGTLLAPNGTYYLVKPEPLQLDDSEMTEEECRELLRQQSRITDPAKMEPLALAELEPDNWAEILAVFVAAGSELNVEDPLDLISLRELSFDGLKQVMLDMCEITYFVEGEQVYLQVRGRGFEDMIERYGLEESRQALLVELMQPEFQGVFSALTGSNAFVEQNEAAADAVRQSLPEGLAVQREQVVVTACGVEGRIPYFWGGKYYELGWNSEWGLPKIVTSPGSITSGTLRPYGLDCSGFVTWAFLNAIGDAAIADAIGSGTDAQWHLSYSVGWDEAQPGDLAFRAMPGKTNFNHVGIVASINEQGDYMIIHCSSVDGTVVLTEAWSSGFRYIRRPYLYGDAS